MVLLRYRRCRWPRTQWIYGPAAFPNILVVAAGVGPAFQRGAGVEEQVVGDEGRADERQDSPYTAGRPAIFKWRQTAPELILGAVRWYLRYSLSLRDVEDLLDERGLKANHTTVWRWVQRYGPALEQMLRRHRVDTKMRTCLQCPEPSPQGERVFMSPGSGFGHTPGFFFGGTQCPIELLSSSTVTTGTMDSRLDESLILDVLTTRRSPAS